MKIEIPTEDSVIILDDFAPICIDFFERMEEEMIARREDESDEEYRQRILDILEEGRKDDDE